METISLTGTTLLVIVLLSVTFIIFAISTLVLLIKNGHLWEGIKNLEKMHDEDQKQLHQRFNDWQASEKAFESLFEQQSDEELLKYYNHACQQIGPGSVDGIDISHCELLARKIKLHLALRKQAQEQVEKANKHFRERGDVDE